MLVGSVGCTECLIPTRRSRSESISEAGIGGVAGRLLSGVLSDRLGQFSALIGIFALQTVSFLIFAYAHSLIWLWLAAAVFGFSYGGGVTVVAPICSVLFGRAHVASVVGALFAIAASPAAIGPWLAGWLHDTTGDYDTAFLLSAGVNALALMLSVVLAVRQATRITRGA